MRKNKKIIKSLAIIFVAISCFSMPGFAQENSNAQKDSLAKKRTPLKESIGVLDIERTLEIDTLDIDKLPDSYIDTVKTKKKFLINDYSLVGFEYGATLSKVMFNPDLKQTMMISPTYFGITYTKYCKMFGYMPYFGMQVGLMFGNEGYKFEKDKETGESSQIEGATEVKYQVLEVPVLAHFHVDFWKMKAMASAGFYGGYRLSIERKGENVAPEIRKDFLDSDKRIDYGFKGGVGFGIILDPIEIHFQGMVKYSWATLYEPDYQSKYFYRYAYPLDITITAGIHYQLNRRKGNTRRKLKARAREIVYGNN